MQGVSLSGTDLGWSLPEAGGVRGTASLGFGGYLRVATPVGVSWSAMAHVCTAHDEARLVSAMVQFGHESGFGNLMVAKASMRVLIIG